MCIGSRPKPAAAINTASLHKNLKTSFAQFIQAPSSPFELISPLSIGSILKKKSEVLVRKAHRKVCFSEENHVVCTIPSRSDLLNEIRKEALWYTSSNIHSFRERASKEVECFKRLVGITETRTACRYLYQPS
jgi:hypothetical protein